MFPMKRKIFSKIGLFIIILTGFWATAYGQSFSADWVDIHRLARGVYRITIRYTNLQLGEYREAYVDYRSKQKAIDVFTKLASGADFYWGTDGAIAFAPQPDPNALQPY